MRVAIVDGLVTLFYDGSRELFKQELNDEWYEEEENQRGPNDDDVHDVEALNVSDACKSYMRERLTWQQVIVMEGVTEIPAYIFSRCISIKRVIFADTVIRIEKSSFSLCDNLAYIKLPISLEFVGEEAFTYCSLSSVFIPPRCREIGRMAFMGNFDLTIMNVPRNIELGYMTFDSTELHQRSPFQGNYGYSRVRRNQVNTWLKNLNNSDQFALHRLCSSFEPTLDMILDTMIEKGGPKAFKEENSVGITPSRYL